VTWTYFQAYTTNLYLIPQGWQYPGRNSASDFNLPMLVQNIGYVSWQASNGNSGQISYTDSWNIFEIIPETNVATASDGIAAWFPDRPTAYQCPVYGATSNDGGGLSQSSKLAIGLTLGLVLGLPLLVFLVWYIVARSRKSNVSFSKTAADMPSPVGINQKETYAKQNDEDGDESVEINSSSPATSDAVVDA